ncbi:hypothetical protein KR038_005432 [Drosophila bunnanda]|nr:hypothetical protein KR038_005432 [Drosophila bunnanda]
MDNNNEMDQEPFDRHSLLTCIKENAENTLPEYFICKRRYVELLGAYINAFEILNALYEQNNVLEYQVALYHLYETGAEAYECLYNLQNLKIQIFNSARSFFQFGNPSELGIATEFVAMFRAFLDQEEDFEFQVI